MNFEITPIEERSGIFVKRDDLYYFKRVNGGKVRSALRLCDGEKVGLVTAGSRKSPQVQIISEIAKAKNLPFVAFTPTGKITKEIQFALENGANVEQVYMGFNNNIIKRAKEAASVLNYRYIPFGMEDEMILPAIEDQVESLKGLKINRIVISIGSGMTLCGILLGMKKFGMELPVLGVIVGADPRKRLDKYAPDDWESNVELVKSSLDYHKSYKENNFMGIELDPIYEAKAIPFLRKGDLFWIVGSGIRD